MPRLDSEELVKRLQNLNLRNETFQILKEYIKEHERSFPDMDTAKKFLRHLEGEIRGLNSTSKHAPVERRHKYREKCMLLVAAKRELEKHFSYTGVFGFGGGEFR